MRVKSITPIRVTAAELARRQARYDELAPAGVEVDLINLTDGPGVPRRLESADDIALSDRLVAVEIARTDPGAHDVVMPDCVLDPGVVSAAGTAPVPVYGILQLASGFLAALGLRFGALTRNKPIAEELRACLCRYSRDGDFDQVEVLDLDVDDIENEEIWNAAIDAVSGRFVARSVRVVVNGCSAVDVRDHHGEAVVIDPTRLALRVLGLAAATQLAMGSRGAAPDTATPDTANPDTANPDTASPDTAIVDL